MVLFLSKTAVLFLIKFKWRGGMVVVNMVPHYYIPKRLTSVWLLS